MLDLVSRKASSNACRVVPLSSVLSSGVGGRALSTFRNVGGGEFAAFVSELGKVLGAQELEKLSALSGWACRSGVPAVSSWIAFADFGSVSSDGNSLASSAMPESPRCRKESLDDFIEADAVWREHAEVRATSLSPLAVAKEKTVS